MRTVDPKVWSKSLKKPRIHVTRPNRFGEEVRNDLESNFRRSLALTAHHYLQSSSVLGMRHALGPDLPDSGKYLWRAIVLSMMVVGSYCVSASLLEAGFTAPLYVALQSTQHHVSKINFPAIGLCSANLISKDALHRFAKFLLAKDFKHRLSEQNILENLRRYGALLNYNQEDIDINFLEYMHSLQGVHNITFITQQLSPTCEELLVRCSWHGSIRNCSELFQQRATMSGYCCVFNSHYDTDSKPERLELIGPSSGLTVMVNVNFSDYVYTLRRNIGTEVLLFDPLSYPLRESGTVSSFWLWPNVVSYLVVSAQVLRASPATRTYSIAKRGCRFPDEESDVEGAGSTFASCLVACRVRTMLQLCDCAPHYMPRPSGRSTCTPNHLGCLNKHKELFLYYYPSQEHDQPPPESLREGLQEELQNSVFCSQCVPDCERTFYRAVHFGTKYSENQSAMLQHAFTHGLSTKNRSMLQVFYKTSEQELYTFDVIMHWYEIISDLGGMCVLLFGMTAVSVAEFIYSFTIRWRFNFMLIRQRYERSFKHNK